MTSLFKACRWSVLGLASQPAWLCCQPTPPSSSTFFHVSPAVAFMYFLPSLSLPARLASVFLCVSALFLALKKDVYLWIHHSQRVVLLLVTIYKFSFADVSLFLALPHATIQCVPCNSECFKTPPHSHHTLQDKLEIIAFNLLRNRIKYHLE